MDLEHHIRQTISLFLPELETHLQDQSCSRNARQPFIIGLTGLQGSGKSTWANGITRCLQQQHKLNAITVSLDDFYRTQDELQKLREQNIDNGLLQVRGQPGTHDLDLAEQFFSKARALEEDEELRIPSFDKSRHSGRGDRTPETSWTCVKAPIDVIVFEGWCLGFMPLSTEQLRLKHQQAQSFMSQEQDSLQKSTRTLSSHPIAHLEVINENLREYCQIFTGPRHFDAFVHIDTKDLSNVYDWRWQQEQALRKQTGSGMTKEEVYAFIQSYMPAYELYLDNLREGFFMGQESAGKRYIRVILDHDRAVRSIQT